MNSITSPFTYLSQAQQIMSLRRHSWIKKVLNQAGVFRRCVVLQGWPGPWWRVFTHFSHTFDREKSFGRKEMHELCSRSCFFVRFSEISRLSNIDLLFCHSCSPNKSRSNWASEAARSGRGPLGGGMDPRGAHLPHPNWFGQISIHQKTGGKILGV